ncbi:hypothetical protein ACFYNY_25125 [Streptomyces sp. NPDC006530]|uniref:hypothetical protein n=1 Tax=Streptomyces sp. NPDC006530 TaxID=3364750 RepID=UPI0036B7C3D3
MATPSRCTGPTPGPTRRDDLYALGATPHFALTGMDPVVVDPNRAANRDRTLACLAAAAPAPHYPRCASWSHA